MVVISRKLCNIKQNFMPLVIFLEVALERKPFRGRQQRQVTDLIRSKVPRYM